MSRPAGSDRAEEEYSSALFLSGAAAGRYSSDALPTGIVARTAAACRKSVGRRRRGKAARRAGTTGSRRVSVACGAICRIGDGRSSIRHGLSPYADRFGGRCGPPAVESGWRQRLLFFLADLPFVACGRDRSGRDRMKSAARDGGLPNAARYADAGRTLKKRRPREGAVKSDVPVVLLLVENAHRRIEDRGVVQRHDSAVGTLFHMGCRHFLWHRNASRRNSCGRCPRRFPVRPLSVASCRWAVYP